jgi:large subunit GTPase 1
MATFAQVIDARDPLTYRSSDLEDYARSISRHKGSMLLLNKSDLLPEVMQL